MKKNVYSAALSLAAAAVLTACGGDGDTDIGSKVVKVSIDEPIGVLEAGRLITVKGTASSSSGKLSTLQWTASNSGASNSNLTLTNADCADRLESNSTFAEGSSDWNCTLTFQAPKMLLAATTYELGLSAAGADFAGKIPRHAGQPSYTGNLRVYRRAHRPVARAGGWARDAGALSADGRNR